MMEWGNHRAWSQIIKSVAQTASGRGRAPRTGLILLNFHSVQNIQSPRYEEGVVLCKEGLQSEVCGERATGRVGSYLVLPR